jgi:formylglycine-generating enzyme required for sulfatase activity
MTDSPTERSSAGSSTRPSRGRRLVVLAAGGILLTALWVLMIVWVITTGYIVKEEGPDGSRLAFRLRGGEKMHFVRIPAGTFLMGSPASEEGHQNDEEPQREVAITEAFYMGIHEVTQAQYRVVMGANPSYAGGPRDPVELVSWYDAVRFCERLSQRTGRNVRLPTEAEWEYASRAGTTTRFSSGESASSLDEYAWHRRLDGPGTKPVGQKKPNAWGLYDMHGNVSEWCADLHHPDYEDLSKEYSEGPVYGPHRIFRGGCAISSAKNCRSTYRVAVIPYFRDIYLGFRVVVDTE